MWTFAGCCVIACVLGYWLRRIKIALVVLVGIVEASVNRAAVRSGERPIRADLPDEIFT